MDATLGTGMQRYAATMSPTTPDPGTDAPAAGSTAAAVRGGRAGAGWAYQRDADGRWRRGLDGHEVADAGDLTLADLYDPPAGEVDGEPVRLVPRAWASRHPDHPLA